MREIEFRDYDCEAKVMRYFNLDQYDREEHNSYGNIMQYTGLKDKNGKEIYEGETVSRGDWKDVVRLGWFECDAFDCYGYEITSCFTDNYDTHAGERFLGEAEVIGNPYENTELLEEK